MTAVLLAAAVALATLAPAAGTQLQTEVVVEGSALELPCVEGIDWRVWDFNGSDVSTCGGYCSAANGSLVFRAVLRQHQGRYACLLGTVAYLVTVIVPPVVKLPEPDGQPLHSGGALNLTYSLLEGAATVTEVRWYRDGLPLAVGGRVSVSGQSLLVRALERGDAGNYSVEVDNNAGTGSDAVTVPVKFPPEVAPIIATPRALVTTTVNVTLVCSIVSNPQVSSVVWTSAVSGTAPSTVSESSQRSESGPHGEVTTTSTVVVLARGAEEQYTYTCTAANALGEDEANITVQEGVVPPAPSGVRVVAVTSTTLTLLWDMPPEPSLVETYLIELRRGRDQWSEAGTTPGDTHRITLEQLLPDTMYQVRVVASNQVGSRTSEVVDVSTAHQVPSLQPSRVVALWNQSGTSVELSWKPPSGAVVEGYIVEVLLPNRTLVQAVTASAPSVSFSALVRGTSYLFEVAAYNSGGVGPTASLMYAIPPERSAPVVSVVRRTPSAFHLSWSRPTDASELTQYRVTVVDSASREQWTAEVGNTSVGHCFSGLYSGRAYQVSLTAVYTDGSSASSGHQDVPKEGSSGGDDGCTAIIPATVSTHPPFADMTLTTWVTVGVVVGVTILFVLTTIIVVGVMCACGCGWHAKQTDLDNNSSSSNRCMTGSPDPPHSPQLKSILVYDHAKDSTKLQYYDVASIFGTQSDHDKAHSQIVGYEV